VLDAFGGSGIWEGTAREAAIGDVYKFAIFDAEGTRHEKADPSPPTPRRHPAPDRWFGTSPTTGTTQTGWPGARRRWPRRADDHLRGPPRELAPRLRGARSPLQLRGDRPQLIEHVLAMGFTHIEFLPLMEHPFYGSWGYQVTGFFAPTSRYGTPQQFMGLVDQLHQAGIGVILDWVPRTFRPTPRPGPLRRHPPLRARDPRMGFHPDWNSLIFNYGRHEVRAFLASSQSSGWAPITPTPCGSTRWRPCSTATTHARQASGCPTSTAGART